MAVTTVVPDGTVSGSLFFTISGGSGSINAALSDNSDSTFIAKTSSVIGQATALLDFGTTTVLATQQVKRVRVRARLATPTSNGRLNIYLGSRISNQNYFHSALTARGLLTTQTLVGPWQTAAPNGSAWTQAAINGLRVKITEYNDSSDIGSFYELFVDVDIVNKPSVTVSAPTSSITSTSSPDVIWAFTDSDSETQSYYQIKVFSQTQYSAPSFVALTSTATWDSGQIASTDATAVVGSLLLAGNYRAYVRAAKTVNGSPYWSDYAFSAFTISPSSTPAIPTLAVSWSASLSYADFTLTGTTNGGFASQYFQVQRSDDSGVTYSYIRNGSAITPNSSFVATAQDYEAPRGLTVFYRVRSVGVTSGSVEIPSDWCTPQQILITNDSTWWFKAVVAPSYNSGSIRVLKQLDVTIEEPNTIFRPLGSSRPIVVAGPLQGEDGSYEIKTISSAEYTSLSRILNYQGTLLIQDPFGNQKYIRLTSRDYSAETINGIIHRNFKLGYVQVSSS
jgi:hypothetical protein